MANGFPEGNFRIVNKATGACISSLYGGQTHGLQAAVTARGEKGVLAYSHTNDRVFTVHDKVKNIEEELWYFDSSKDSWGDRRNMLYNKVNDIRSRWVLGANVETVAIAYKLFDKDLETFLSLLPEQDEETLAHLRTFDFLDIITILTTLLQVSVTEMIYSEPTDQFDDKKFEHYLNKAKRFTEINNTEQNVNTTKNILKTVLKSEEVFEQLLTALNSMVGKEHQSFKTYGGKVFLQGSGRSHQTRWTFEDGYIFVEGQPVAVLTHTEGSSVNMSHRSDDPNQRWEFK